MLQRTFTIWKKVTLDAKASGAHTPGQQPADMALAQLGINYRWSDIVLDELHRRRVERRRALRRRTLRPRQTSRIRIFTVSAHHRR